MFHCSISDEDCDHNEEDGGTGLGKKTSKGAKGKTKENQEGPPDDDEELGQEESQSKKPVKGLAKGLAKATRAAGPAKLRGGKNASNTRAATVPKRSPRDNTREVNNT